MPTPFAHWYAKLSSWQRLPLIPLTLVAAFLLTDVIISIQGAIPGFGSASNGFDLSNTAIPAKQILHGGPPRDGIPALSHPAFVDAGKADFLLPQSRILGVSIGGKAKAYPIAILNHHEIVNDRLAGKDITVSFCPLCGTGIVYDARLDGQLLEFGVSGLLYNSDVLLYDKQSESLWSQILSKAISGPMSGKTLTRLPALHTSWHHWQSLHPDTRVLSQHTGYTRNYQGTPYKGYNHSQTLYFPVANQDKRYHNKEVVLTVEINGKAKAYPFKELALYQQQSGRNKVFDTLGGQSIAVEFDLASRSGRIIGGSGKEIPGFQAFWFAWIAFYPDSEVFTAAQ
ncbi:DUF3179 domain-containing protein [Thalassomonas haliotis]|uniref:DUF3179 domain-containing protein n=1 Tax=Thalassomonas haliotis TaxID=485448 RepID=A0ABY7V6X9_9GAMM|nr:DUF3179 domain-containing protein [Thalassomonas haliotis]WDE09416.1 DUF3179 domain-containing protein [Thalassomonas haliotis]